MSRRIAIVVAATALALTALSGTASAQLLPPISGPLTDIQVEGPLMHNIML